MQIESRPRKYKRKLKEKLSGEFLKFYERIHG